MFEILAEREKQVEINEEVVKNFMPYSLTQRIMSVNMYVTDSGEKYINDPDIKLLRKWEIQLPELDNFEEDNTVSLTLKFGHVEILATAKCKDLEREITFKYDLD